VWIVFFRFKTVIAVVTAASIANEQNNKLHGIEYFVSAAPKNRLILLISYCAIVLSAIPFSSAVNAVSDVEFLTDPTNTSDQSVSR
jgi:hypothetical protein